jgi:hypothetical protein
MSATPKVLRSIVMLLCVGEAALYLFLAYSGFSVARFYNAQPLMRPFNAVSFGLGILFSLTLVVIRFGRRWSRWAAALSFGSSLIWTIYVALEYTFHWTQLMFGVMGVFGLLWAAGKESAVILGGVSAST